jgi:WD40 repeat protein
VIKKLTITIITVPMLFLSIMSFSLSEGESMKQKHPNKLDQVSFISYQNLIVGAYSTGTTGSIRFWSLNGELKDTIDLGKGEWVKSLAISNSGNSIVVALLSKNEIACFSLVMKQWLWRARWIGESVVHNTMRFTSDDQKVVVVGYKNIVTYDANTGTLLSRIEDSGGFSAGLPLYETRINGISPSARFAAFWQGNLEHDEGWRSSRNIWVNVRDIEGDKVIAKHGKIQEKYKNCAGTFSADEKDLVLGSMDGHVRVWSISGRKMIREWHAYGSDEKAVPFDEMASPNPIYSMILSSNGKLLATMGHLRGRSAVRVWDYLTGKRVHEFDDVISSAIAMCSSYPMAFNADGNLFVLERQGQLCLYETQNWKSKWCVKL